MAQEVPIAGLSGLAGIRSDTDCKGGHVEGILRLSSALLALRTAYPSSNLMCIFP